MDSDVEMFLIDDNDDKELAEEIECSKATVWGERKEIQTIWQRSYSIHYLDNYYSWNIFLSQLHLLFILNYILVLITAKRCVNQLDVVWNQLDVVWNLLFEYDVTCFVLILKNNSPSNYTLSLLNEPSILAV